MLQIKSNKHFNRKIYIFGIICAVCLIFLGSIITTLALFSSSKKDYIDINFNDENVKIDAILNPDSTDGYADVTLLKFFKPSVEVPYVDLLQSAQITLSQSSRSALNARFRIGFEYYDAQNINNEKLQTIISYLNNSVDFSSVVSTNPYIGCSWVFNVSSGYYELKSGDSLAVLDSSAKEITISMVDSRVVFSGIENLNIDKNLFTGEDKNIFEKISLAVQFEIVDSGSNFSINAPTYSYGKVAIFDTNGGDKIEAKLLTGDNVVLPNATKGGQTFDGWYGEAAYNTLIGQAGQTVAQTEKNKTYYASFSPTKYVVTLDPNGGILYGSTSLHILNNVLFGEDFLSSPAITYKTGYEFLGYFDENNLCYINEKGEAIRKWDKTESATLTAKYSNPLVYNIVYTNIEPEAYFGDETVYDYTFGDVKVVPNPIKGGYDFDGWLVNGNSNPVKDFTINATTSGTIYLEAKFTPINYTATLTYGGTTSNLTYNIESGLTLPTVSASYAGFQVQSKVGNWEQGERYAVGSIVTQRFGNVTLVAVNAIEGIIFDGNTKDDFYVEPIGLGIDTDATVILPNAYRDGYIFQGWYFDSACTQVCERVYKVDLSDFDEEYKLYAKWTAGEAKYTVTLHNDNGLDQTIEFTQNSEKKGTFNIPSTIVPPVKNGYVFAGYYTKENSEGFKFYNNAGASLIAEFTNAYTTSYEYTYDLYASWVQNLYSITFDTNGGTAVSTIYYTSNTESVNYPTTAKYGYTFKGWEIVSQDGNWSTTTIGVQDVINTLNLYGNVALKAIFEPIVYNATFYYLALDDTTKQFTTLTQAVTYTLDDTVLTLPSNSLTGHLFKGWEVTSGMGSWKLGQLYDASTTTINLNSSYYGDVNFTARYDVTTYTINFEYLLNGVVQTGEEYVQATKPIYFTYQNTSVTLRNLLDNIGYEFNAWKPKANAGAWQTTESFMSGEVVSITADRLYNVTLVSDITKFFDSGDGSTSNPFIIKTSDQLHNLSTVINSPTLYQKYSSLSYELGGDIMIVGDTKTSVSIDGTNHNGIFVSIGTTSYPFKGIFDGKGYTISNLITATSQKRSSGLFGLTDGATIRNVNLEGAKIYSSNSGAGAIVAYAINRTLIENCHNNSTTGTILSIANNVGGIVGEMYNSTIKNSSNKSSVSGYNQLGGVVGGVYENSVVYNVANYGSIYANKIGSNAYDVGGVIGKIGGSASTQTTWGSCIAINLYNAGAITTKQGSNYSSAVGTIVGYKGYASYVFNAYSDGVLTYYGTNTGPGGGIGSGRYNEQNDTTQSANGLRNIYYKENTYIRTDGTTNTYVNDSNVDGYNLSENAIIGNGVNIITDYAIYGTKAFASLATLFNAWIYDLVNMSGLMPPRHYTMGSDSYVDYDSLYEYIQVLGFSNDDLNYWIKSTTPTKTAYITQPKDGLTSIYFKIVDLNGGSLNGTYSRVYGKVVKSDGTLLYEDSEIIYKKDFTRSGYRFVGLNTQPDGKGTFINPQTNTNGEYYNITVGDVVGVEKYYAVWERLFAEGEGTKEKPYMISNGQHLVNLAQLVKSNADNGAYATAYYHQSSEIHLEDFEGFAPIGTSTYPFKGYYYGYNKIIYNDKIDLASTDNVGLFGYTSGATLMSIKVYFSNGIKGKNNVGGIVGYAKDTIIIDCENQSTNMTGTNYVGGIAGYLIKSSGTSMIINSRSSANVTGTNNVGGLVGRADNSIIENNVLHSTRTIKGTTNVGGVCGYMVSTKILNIVVHHIVSCTNTAVSGKLVGVIGGTASASTLSYCYYNSAVNTQLQNVGTGTGFTSSIVVGYAPSSPYKLSSSQTIGGYTAQTVYQAMHLYIEHITHASASTYILGYWTNSSGGITPYPNTYTSYMVVVTFCTNADVNWSVFPVQSGYRNFELEAPTKPTRTGYTFLGWYDASGNQIINASNEIVGGTYLVSKNMILYAKWQSA